MAFTEPEITVWKLDSGEVLLLDTSGDNGGYFPGIYSIDAGGAYNRD